MLWRVRNYECACRFHPSVPANRRQAAPIKRRRCDLQHRLSGHAEPYFQSQLVWRHRDANANFHILPGRRRHPLRRDETGEQPARSEAVACVAKDRRSSAVPRPTRINPLNESCFAYVGSQHHVQLRRNE